MCDVRNFFREIDNAFTIYVVERKFASGRGSDYFRSFKGTPNYIDSDKVIKKHIGGILYHINQHIPSLGDLINSCFTLTKTIDIVDIISMLSKVFTVHEHQAAGPEVIDPIIIQEGKILQKYVNQMIALHKNSILRPAIIIILKDDNFIRAKEMLSLCPHGTNIKFIRNSGETEMHKVINCGVNNPDDFLDAFTLHCFSTCSNTKRSVLLNREWSENSLIKLYSPSILQIRTKLLYRDKTQIRDDINDLMALIGSESLVNDNNKYLLEFYEVILRLFRVFAYDGGADDIKRANELAHKLNNEILIAQVNKCSYFIPNIGRELKDSLLDSAYDTFVRNDMEDQAIYCRNNRLVRQFDTATVNVYDFQTLQQEALYNVPGLVGMSHIFNNSGVAHLVSGYPDLAIELFDKGLDYAYRPERCLQKIALLTNKAITNAYCYDKIDESELRQILNIIFDNIELQNIPFITARYALNIISLGYSQSRTLGDELCNLYDVENLIHRGINDNKIGTLQLQTQLDIMSSRYDFKLKKYPFKKRYPKNNTSVRQQFIEKTGFVPFFFSTWF